MAAANLFEITANLQNGSGLVRTLPQDALRLVAVPAKRLEVLGKAQANDSHVPVISGDSVLPNAVLVASNSLVFVAIVVNVIDCKEGNFSLFAASTHSTVMVNDLALLSRSVHFLPSSETDGIRPNFVRLLPVAPPLKAHTANLLICQPGALAVLAFASFVLPPEVTLAPLTDSGRRFHATHCNVREALNKLQVEIMMA